MSYSNSDTLVNTITTNAQFRTWGSGVTAKLALMSLVKVVEAAQIDWATVATPGVANTAAGYEMWRMDDALQATVPIFIKIEYGSGAAAANGAIWVSLGSSSNGAGVLNGVVMGRTRVSCTATAGAIQHHWSGANNRFAFCCVGATAATSMLISVERTVDTAGAVSSEGALVIYRADSAYGQMGWNQVTGNYTASWESTLGCMGCAVAPFAVTGLQVAVYPVYINKGVFCNPGYGVFMYENATIGAGATISMTVYAAAHTFMPLGNTVFACTGRGGFSAGCIMMRYE